MTVPRIQKPEKDSASTYQTRASLNNSLLGLGLGRNRASIVPRHDPFRNQVGSSVTAAGGLSNTLLLIGLRALLPQFPDHSGELGDARSDRVVSHLICPGVEPAEVDSGLGEPHKLKLVCNEVVNPSRGNNKKPSPRRAGRSPL